MTTKRVRKVPSKKATAKATQLATVVNINFSDCDIFCGRPSIFGNQFKIGVDGTREEVIEKYKEWFYAPQRENLRQHAIRRLSGKKCGCYCKPEACHVDVIVEFVNKNAADTT